MANIATTFKGYSEKSKAKRGLAAFGELAVAAADKLIFMGPAGASADSLKWGFNVEEAEAVRDGRNVEPAAPVEATVVTPVEELPEAVSGDEKFGAAVNSAREENPNVPGAFFSGLMRDTTLPVLAGATTVSTTTNRPVRSGKDVRYKIEKNRDESNGVKRPSEGGICRQIWDAIDAEKQTTGQVPSLKEMKVKLSHLDMTTVSVQYYRWRKFQGIAGRLDAAK